MNVSDSERVASSLQAQGYEITANADAADVLLFNTCSVREKAEHKLYNRIGRVRKSLNTKPMVGVLGCVAQLEGETLFRRNAGIDFVIGTKAVGRVSEAIESVSGGATHYSDLGEREFDYDWSVSETGRNSPYIEFVPIIEGCNKFCTYCIVPFSRGRERSLPAADIIRELHRLKSQGVREVQLIGQNVNSYRPLTDAGLEGVPGATSFSRLLRAAAATGMERIKFTTSFPRDFHPDIVDALDEYTNLCNWVHLPVQSGSDRILRSMRRGHSIDSYKQKIDRIKNSPRQISLTTDIIVGFPGETEEDFRETVKLVEYCEYDSAYIFKYSPRFGTPAFEMDDNVTEAEKTQRFLELEATQKSIQNRCLKRYLDRTIEVLIEKVSTRSNADVTGHSTCNKLVNLPGPSRWIGQLVNVNITEIKANSLFGEAC